MAALVERQREALNALEIERDHFKGAFEEADAERQRLELMVRQLVRAQFGRKSERLDPDQFQLTLENVEQEIAAIKATRQDAGDSDASRRSRRTPARRNLGHLPAHLDRYEVVIEPESRSCPCCGGAMHQIDVEETERLDAVPLRLRVRVIRRPIYGCRSCGEAVVQATAPDSAVPGGLPTEALLAHLAVSKYCDGLPLYRQVQILERDGIRLDRATLSDWMGRTAWWLKPLWELLLTSVLSSPKLFCDDTRLPVLAPGKGRTRTGYLWGLARDDTPWQGDHPPAVAYVYTEDRVWDRAREVLADYAGVLQVDGWGGFERLAGKQDAVPNDAGAVTLAFCWSHGRRQFFEIHQSSQSPIAGEVLRRIAELYRIEDEIRGQPPDVRRTVRQDRSRPKVEALKVYLEEQLARVSGKMPVAKAIRYMLRHWAGLCVFLNDGRVELDTNSIERLHRIVATTRKNALFAGADSGARSWAIFTSLIQSARMNGLNPFEYLKDVLERIVSGDVKAHQLDCLLPWTWRTQQSGSQSVQTA
ncbi:IS66 family transposase [Skermanella mucosa]|uniref:IS66 family transposase n=1 Tax=Skermanella mucosa TaxID=1789672 RepID=UPI00389AB14D